SRNLIYLKKAPDYLGCYSRDENGKLIKSNHPACFNFVQGCNSEDVGCEKYTPITGEPYLPAVAKDRDNCPAECVGYNSFREMPTSFYPPREVNFIPQLSQTCPANEVGCDGYTNLEEVARGGEGREFYSYLRPCQKPDSNCAYFYTWIGSETRGYELKRYYLRKNETGQPFEILPKEKAEEIWGKCQGPEDARINPNCREFYSEEGNISYRLYKNTVTCSPTCIQLRKNKPISASFCWPFLFKDNDPLKNQPLIDGLSFTPTGGESCSVPSGQQTCLTPSKEICDLGKKCVPTGAESCPCYTGICTLPILPKESVKCSASSDGCREYKGNNANNIKISFFNDFESGSYYPWQPISGSSLIYSNESIYAFGHSLKIEEASTPPQGGETKVPKRKVIGKRNDILKVLFQVFKTKETKAQYSAEKGAIRPVNGLVFQGKSYLLSFLAKGTIEGQTISAKFFAEGSAEIPFPTINISEEWKLFVLGPVYFDRIPDANEKLQISSPNNFWLDNIQLRDTGSLYLIRNSWFIPNTCNDKYGNPIMIGCAEYRDRENKPHYLKSFSKLCAEEFIGCEALIETQNSFSPFEERFNEDKLPPTDDVIVPADKIEYLVYDKNFACQAQDKGCQKFGLPNLVGGKAINYSDVFLKNDPDLYLSRPILCRQTQQDCEEFTVSGGGSVYLKDPNEKQCQWREKVVIGTETKTGWFKQGTDQPCYEDYGIRLRGDPLYQGYVGLCPDKSLGCKKFIDPLLTTQTNYLEKRN
ncbi:MAG: hypothetical protein ACK413_03170, partial [Patescibacteria group bacterium]